MADIVTIPLGKEIGLGRSVVEKKVAEEESLIECYTCGLETEDPEVDQVSLEPKYWEN